MLRSEHRGLKTCVYTTNVTTTLLLLLLTSASIPASGLPVMPNPEQLTTCSINTIASAIIVELVYAPSVTVDMSAGAIGMYPYRLPLADPGGTPACH